MHNKSVLIVAVLLITVIALGLFVKGLNGGRPVPQKVEKPVTQTTLYFNPDSVNSSEGETFSAQIYMDTKGEAVTGFDLELNYDPNILEITNVYSGRHADVFTQVIRNSIDNEKGSIFYSAFTLNKDLAVNGDGKVVFQVEGRVKDAQGVGGKVSFGPQTVVAAVNRSFNVLSNSVDLVININ